MQKIVQNGCRTATVTLDGSECKVVFDRGYNVFNVKSDSNVTVALFPDKSEGDDGVMVARENDPVFYPHMRNINTVYLNGTGTAEVFASDVAVPVFKKRVRGGGNKPIADNYIQDGLIAEWVLDENLNEVLTNPSFISDSVLERTVGNVVNGEPSFFVKKDSLNYLGNRGVTLQCLVNIDQAIARVSNFLTIGVNLSGNVALGIGMDSAGKIIIAMPNDDRSVNYTLLPGIWYQISIIYNEITSLIELCVNSESVISISKELEIQRLMSGAAIGTWVWSSAFPNPSSVNRGNFKIANCCVYDRPLTFDEIAVNYAVDKKRYGI